VRPHSEAKGGIRKQQQQREQHVVQDRTAAFERYIAFGSERERKRPVFLSRSHLDDLGVVRCWCAKDASPRRSLRRKVHVVNNGQVTADRKKSDDDHARYPIDQTLPFFFVLTISILIKEAESFLEFSNLFFGQLVRHCVCVG
jgi:hypothetical protein